MAHTHQNTGAAPLIHIAHLSFEYHGEPVLDDVNLQVHRGEYVGLIGPNGSGKTTLLQIMLGVLPTPATAQVELFGTPVSAFRQWWRIGYVPQKATAFNAGFPATVAEVVTTGRSARRGLLRPLTAADHQAVTAALDRVGMLPQRHRLVGRLSGGQQQRVFIARALANEPELLILDEPTVGVDIEAEAQFYAMIRHLRAQMGLTVVLVSHDIGAVGHEVTALACLNRKLFYHGSPADFGTDEQLCELYGHHVRSIHHHHHV